MLERFQSRAAAGAHRHGVGVEPQQPIERAAVLHGVDLVQHQQRVFRVDAQLFEHLIHRGDLLLRVRVARIGHVQE